MKLHPTTAELADLFMAGVAAPAAGDSSEDQYFDVLFTNFAGTAASNPRIADMLDTVMLLAGPMHEQVYDWQYRRRQAAKPGEKTW